MKIYNSEQLYHVMVLIQKLEKESICDDEEIEAINNWYSKEYEKLYLCGFDFNSNQN